MKALKVLSFLIIGLMIYSCNPMNEGQAAVANSDLTLSIDGMVCEIGCAKTIEEKMALLEGVVKAEVDFNEKTAHILYDNSILTGLSITEQIEKMNGGQYVVKVITDKTLPSKNSGEVENNSDDKASIQERTFSFPQLITYFTGSL